MKKTKFLLAITFFSLNVSAQNTITHIYPFTDGPDKNPMKGWNSGWWDNFNQSSVGFQYLGWKDFEPTDDNFNYDAIEDIINRPGSNGKHLILRLYTDWFGDNPTSAAGPAWLYNDYNVERLQAPNGKYITNYNNPNYISQVTEAIEALSVYFDNDPRVYTIQLGVLGYWGEWHTFSFNDSNFIIEDVTANQILDVYKSNFTNTKLMGRYPWREPLSTDNIIGYHNDFFKPNDGHSNDFDDAILAGNKWLNSPIGGEIPPVGLDREQFMTDLYETPTGMNMIETGHYSTMKVGSEERPCDTNPTGVRCEGFMTLHRKMGYNYQIESALFEENLSQTEELSLELNIKNIGVAPMYYNWDIQYALLNEQNEAVEIFDVVYDLKSLLPSENAYSISTSTTLNTISEGNYQLALRIIQPGADIDKTNPWALDARNTYILFSNDLTVIDGQWDTNNALKGGWSVLGNIAINNSTLGNNDNEFNNSINIYPNPTKDKLYIANNSRNSIKSIKLYDVTGRKIKVFSTVLNPNQSIDISNLLSGTYYLIIDINGNSITRQILKN